MIIVVFIFSENLWNQSNKRCRHHDEDCLLPLGPLHFSFNNWRQAALKFPKTNPPPHHHHYSHLSSFLFTLSFVRIPKRTAFAVLLYILIMAYAPSYTVPTVFLQPPPFLASPRSVDLSPLEFILALLALITIPALIYAFFFTIKCPPWPFRRRRNYLHRSNSSTRTATTADDDVVKASDTEIVTGVKYQKETHVKDIGAECPVCLSVFADGEEIKQLSACKHSFHASCINMWLKSHSNCPICRASVPVKRPTGTASSARGRDDLQQGLPDAAGLV